MPWERPPRSKQLCVPWAIERGIVPPTMNLDEADPDCDLDYVANEARELRVDVAMNNASGFGGTHASIILKRFDP